MDSHTKAIRQFLAGSMPNTWLIHPHISIYVRKAFHVLGPERRRMHTFDVANIAVDTPVRGQGIFTNWLTLAEAEASQHGMDAVFVENLLNLRLADWLARRGYTQCGEPELPSFYLIA